MPAVIAGVRATEKHSSICPDWNIRKPQQSLQVCLKPQLQKCRYRLEVFIVKFPSDTVVKIPSILETSVPLIFTCKFARAGSFLVLSVWIDRIISKSGAKKSLFSI